MSGSSLAELQKAVYTALDGDATLSALISAVHDHAPQEPVFPYVQIGHTTTIPWDDKSKDGQEHTITIHSWSQYEGHLELKQVMDAVRDVLHNGALSVTEQNVVLIRCEFEEPLLDPDSITHHGVQRFRVITEEA